MRRRAAAVLALALALLGSSAARADAEPGRGWDQALRDSQAAIGRAVAPDVAAMRLLDSHNAARTLADWRGKPLVVSFVYTGCFESCPLITQRLKRAIEVAREALGRDSFNVVSIGFNQPFDGPEAMAALARQAQVNDPHWSFVSPQASDVAAITQRFGFSFEASPKGFDHIAQLSIVDAQGVIAAQVYGEDFELPLFVGPLKDLMSGQAAQRFSVDNLWRKVKLFCTVYDPASGRYKLNYSLFFEIFCGVSVLAGLAWFMARELRANGRAR